VRAGSGRDLADQLEADGGGEIFEAGCRHRKSAGPADHIVAEELGQIVEAFEDRQTVHGHPLGNRLIAADKSGQAAPVGPVVGNIDDLAPALIRVFVDRGHAVQDGVADGGAAGIEHARHRFQFFGERLDIFCASDQAPGDDRNLQGGAAPFGIGEGDLAEGPRLDGVEDARMAERFYIAQALQLELIGIDAARTIGHQDQFQIDGGLPCRRAGRHRRKYQDQPNHRSLHGMI